MADEEEVEEWRVIPGYEGLYEASSLGRIRSVAHVRRVRTRWGNTTERKYRARVLQPAKRGYRGLYDYVCLSVDGKKRSLSVHTLVLLAHRGPPPFEDAEVLHGPNHDPSDNRACNLRWGTHEENNDDRNRNNGYGPYDAAEYLRESADVDAQAQREGWDPNAPESPLDVEEEAPF